MSTVGKTWRFVREQLRVNVLCNMEYRVSFLTQVVFMFLNDILLLFFWWILFKRFDNIAGWRQNDIFLLYAMSAGAYGLAYTVFGNAIRLSSLIVEGQLDYYLALPKDVWLNVLISRSLASTIGDFIFGVAICTAIYGLSIKVLIAAFYMAIAALLLTSAVTIAHCMTFFMGNAEQVAAVFSEAMLSFSLYPISLFSLSIRVLLYTAIPAAFVSFIPVTLVREFSPILFAVFLGVTAFSVWLSRRVFYAGLKRYESGNLVAPRM